MDLGLFCPEMYLLDNANANNSMKRKFYVSVFSKTV